MPPVTFEQVGIAVMLIMGFAGFFFAVKKHYREERAMNEPRHSPSIDEKIENRARTLEEKIDKETHQLHGRVSGLREEIRTELTKNADEIRGAAKEMQTMFNTTVKQIGKMEGELNQINQQVHATNSQLQRHIENDK